MYVFCSWTNAFMKVEAIIGKIDEAIMNFEKVSKAATAANAIRSIFENAIFKLLDFYRSDPSIHMLLHIWMSMPCF